MERKNKRPHVEKIMNAVGLAGVGGLAVTFLMMIAPVLLPLASAVSGDDVLMTDVNTNVAALVRSSISVAVTSRISLDLTPSSKGTFNVGTAKLNVATNNTTGYAVYLRTRDDSQALLPAQSDVIEVIGAPDGAMTSDNYQSNLNTWGYAVANDDDGVLAYRAIPTSDGAAIIRTDKTGQEDSYDLSFGVAIGPDLPSGIYSNELIVSVVANPIEVRSLTDLTFMQEMTPEVCRISYEDEKKQLIDSRDSKRYWVTKLADGNCWMTQNLALVFGDNDGQVRTLSPTDSDVKERWNVENATELEAAEQEFDVNSTQSWQIDSGEQYAGIQVYYQWNTVTAGTGQDTNQPFDIAESSICPKGWKLPLGGDVRYDTVSGSYNNLFLTYGVADLSNGRAVLLDEPLNFTVGGLVQDKELKFYSNDGHFWTGVAGSAGTAYRIFYNSGLVYLNRSNIPWYQGLMVRCVAR